MKFSYSGKDRSGKAVSGSLEDKDRLSAASKLRARGIKVTKLTKESGGDINIFGGKVKIKAMDLMMMTRQMATLLRAGVPIATAVHSIATQVEEEGLRGVMENVES